MKIMSRKRAKEEDHRKYYTGLPCENGHDSYRNTRTGNCIECQKMWNSSGYAQKSFNRNMDKYKENGSKTYEYNAWLGVKARCNNPKHASYKNYGGRGIVVCERWEVSFENFLSDVGKRPHENLTLDRINNDLGYSPENVRWASPAQQANNRRNPKNTSYISYNGFMQRCLDLSKEFNIPLNTVYRYSLNGFSFEDVLSNYTPKERRLVEFRGETKTISEWAREIVIDRKTLTYRLDSGWTVEQSLTTPAKGNKND